MIFKPRNKEYHVSVQKDSKVETFTYYSKLQAIRTTNSYEKEGYNTKCLGYDNDNDLKVVIKTN